MPDVISDTSPLQYLFQVDLLEVLKFLYGESLIPGAVDQELLVGRHRGVALPDPAALSWIAIASPRSQRLLPLAPDLGPGEREAIALAAEKDDSLLLLDDLLARRHAQLLGLKVTGTLGVLLKAKQKGHLLEVAPVLDRLHELGFRLDPKTRAAVLNLAQE